jgi:hypothetical protein
MARRGSKDSEQRFLVGSREEPKSKSKPTNLVVPSLVQRRGRAEEEETARGLV